MTSKKITNWTIFYSWQSDLPPDNQKAILEVLRNVFTDIESGYDNIKLTPDEATRDTAGSPDIPDTIFQKISDADVFVCDLTTINASAPANQRKVPNPNVAIELGFAIANLGWERIILIFNKAYGKFPDDLPFDTGKRRVLDFKITGKTDNNGKGQLKSELIKAIKTIIDKKPLKQIQSKQLTSEERKRNSDITNLKWALNAIHLPSMDDFITDIPYKINGRIFHFWEGFNGVMTSSLFHLYDTKAKSLITKFYKHWKNTVSFGHRYRPHTFTDQYFFGPPNDLPLSKDEQKDWDFIKKERNNIYKAFQSLLKYVREKYIEID